MLTVNLKTDQKQTNKHTSTQAMIQSVDDMFNFENYFKFTYM